MSNPIIKHGRTLSVQEGYNAYRMGRMRRGIPPRHSSQLFGEFIMDVLLLGESKKLPMDDIMSEVLEAILKDKLQEGGPQCELPHTD